MESLDGGLNFKVGLDNSQLAADAAKAKALLMGIGDAGVAQGARLDNAFNKATKAASSYANIMALGAVASIGMLGREILSTTAKFEKFGIVLKNTLGDTKGADALSMIANFAATTPFQLDEVTGAFIKMANQGFVPTRQEMVKLGDLASSTGKSFDQLAEAVLDAQTGEFERLKEFGIKASANGDRVTFSFKEQKTTVENTNKAIQNYLLSLGELNGVAGANAKISESLTGQLSNLGDKMDAMFNKIGSDNKGILYAAVAGASKLIDNYELVGEAVGALVAVYGIAKVATMVWVAQENAKAAVVTRNIAIETEYTALMATQNTMMMSRAQIAVIEAATRVKATNNVIAAEERLAATTKTTALFNPYTALAVAIAAVGYAIYKVVTYQTDLEKATKKAHLEIENEKDKAAQLFAELKNAKEGTDDWKKAKQGILDQWGSYLTEQQKELVGVKAIADAYDSVNRGIEENIALKVKQESLEAISKKYNDKIVDANTGIQDAVKEKLGRDRAASVGQEIAPLIANVKIAVDKESRDKATKELQDYLQNLAKEVKGDSKILDFDPDVMRFRGDLFVALKNFSDETIAINNAFQVQQKKIADAKTDPILTTYKAQIEEIKRKKAIAEKELEILKNTPGENPMKAIVAKQGEIDEYNKQLGIKEKAAKEENAAIEAIKKAQEDLDKAVKSGNQSRIDSAAKVLEKLQQEKDLMDGIAESALAVARNTTIQSKGEATISGILEEMKKATGLDFSEASKLPKTIAPEWDKLKAKIDDINKKSEKFTDDQVKHNHELASYYYAAADAANYLTRSLGEGNEELAAMLSQLANIGELLGNLAEKGFKLSKSEGIGLAISGATQLIGMVINQAAENKRVMKEYYANIIAQQREYNLLLNDQIRLNSDIKSSVFLNNYEGRITDSVKALNDAQKGYNEAAKKFNSSEAIVGKKNVVSGGNVLSGIGAGAALGAGIGSVVPVIGTVVGAVGGAIVGAFVGLFAKKKKDVTAPLLETYPALIDANGEFNASLAKTLIANKQVTEETAATLQNLIDWKEKADEARKQMTQVISDLAGSLGDNLRNALVTAFEDGTNAAKVFGDEVSKVLENVLANMLFNKAFEGLFTKLEDDMNASFGIGVDPSDPRIDNSWMDDLTRFFKNSPEAIAKFNQGLADAKKAAGLEGLDIFSGTDTRTGSSKGIAQASQDSVDELNGRFTAIQGHTFSMSKGVDILVNNSNKILEHVAGIKGDTARLENIENSLASVKSGIDTINLKGITLKP